MLLKHIESSMTLHLHMLNPTENTVVKVERGLHFAIVEEFLGSKKENVDCKVDPDRRINFPAQVATQKRRRSGVVHAESIIAHCFGSGLLCGLENRRCRRLVYLGLVLTSNGHGDVP
jgi:hypothetical protein